MVSKGHEPNDGELHQLRMKGVLFGHAVGDALGLGARFLTRAEMRHHYPKGLRSYADIALLDHLRLWRRGDWTDATGQLLCVFDTLHLRGRVDPETLARLLHDRLATGGFTGLKPVLEHPLFLLSPFEAAREPIRGAGSILADNGAIKRTAIIGIWNADDLATVKTNAESACLVTHPLPTCVHGCIALACAIAELVQGKSVEEALGTADRMSGGAFAEFFAKGIDEPIASYRLDETDRSNPPEKALFAGFHALKHAVSFLDGLCSVIEEGGDASANGAVAGALLGARFGFSGIPENLVQGLNGAAELEERLQDRISGRRPELPENPVPASIQGARWKMRIRAWWAAFFHFLERAIHLPIAALRTVTRAMIWILAFLTGWITEDVFYVEDSEGKQKIIGLENGPARDMSIFSLGVLLILGFGLVSFWTSFSEAMSRVPSKEDIIRALHSKVSQPQVAAPLSRFGSASQAATVSGSAAGSIHVASEAASGSCGLLPETASNAERCAMCGRPFDDIASFSGDR